MDTKSWAIERRSIKVITSDQLKALWRYRTVKKKLECFLRETQPAYHGSYGRICVPLTSKDS